jgi:hypothetical protein
MFESIMTVCVAAFVLVAIAGHVALLRAVLTPNKVRQATPPTSHAIRRSWDRAAA